jgi:zinc transport system substrate-binding protein
MKKILLTISIVILTIFISGCFKRDNFEDIEIYTTSYPIEYITNYLYGDHSTVISVYPDGVNIDEYRLTDEQIKEYSKSKLFIFNGLGIEKDYVLPMFKLNKDLKIIDAAKTMSVTNDIIELWVDPSNFLMLASNIRNGLHEYIDNHYLKNSISEKYDELKLNISALDANIKLMADGAVNKTIIVDSDAYLFLKKYNLEVISLENANEKTINTAINLINSEKVKTVFRKQYSTNSDALTEVIKATNIETTTLHSLTNINSEERLAKADYVSIMNNNIELIRNELY